MQRVMAWIVAAAMSAGSFAARAQGDTKAADLLAQARQALGGSAPLAAVKTLKLDGSIRRRLGDRQVDGDLTLTLSLPDRMLRTDAISPLGDAVLVSDQGVDGDRLLRGFRAVNAPPGMAIRTPPPPTHGSDAEAEALRAGRAELARLTVLMLLRPPAPDFEFSYGGEAESPDGHADVIDIRGPSSFVARLLLDGTTHRPVMLLYRGTAPRMVVATRHGDDRPASPAPDAGPVPAADPVEIALFVDDYRTSNGLLLPHHVIRSVAGETSEEWTFRSVTVNPSLAPDAFKVK